MNRFLRLVSRDLRLALRQGSDATVAVMFFVLCVVLFPFGVGPEPNILARIAAGVIWVAALLASLLSLERLFQNDYEDGSLELLTLTSLPLEAVVFAKVLAHWLVTGLPLIVAAPLLALLLNMEPAGFPVLIATLAVGTPTLSLIGAMGAALTLGARRGGVLLSLLILPLYIPVLIFGAGAIDASVRLHGPAPSAAAERSAGRGLAAGALGGGRRPAAGDRVELKLHATFLPETMFDLLHSGLTRSGRTAERTALREAGMALKAEQLKGELTEQIVSRVHDRLNRDRAGTAERFVRQFYANVPPDDILELSPDQLYSAALSIWQFAAQRRAWDRPRPGLSSAD